MIGTVTRAPLMVATKQQSKSRFAAVDHSNFLADTLRQRMNSPRLRIALNLVSIVAPTTINVLVQGGLNTDRLLVAETIRDMSDRRLNAFVTVNCASLAASQIELELFGDASRLRRRAHEPTCFVRAFRGTLFLNDVEFIPRRLQRRLLDVLRYREAPSGGHSAKIDVRLITASGLDLAGLVERFGFDDELHNLLRIFPIDLAQIEHDIQAHD